MKLRFWSSEQDRSTQSVHGETDVGHESCRTPHFQDFDNRSKLEIINIEIRKTLKNTPDVSYRIGSLGSDAGSGKQRH